jgi:hypothetical protein
MFATPEIGYVFSPVGKRVAVGLEADVELNMS